MTQDFSNTLMITTRCTDVSWSGSSKVVLCKMNFIFPKHMPCAVVCSILDYDVETCRFIVYSVLYSIGESIVYSQLFLVHCGHLRHYELTAFEIHILPAMYFRCRMSVTESNNNFVFFSQNCGRSFF